MESSIWILDECELKLRILIQVKSGAKRRGGVTELKMATIDDMLELDDSDDTEDI